MKISITYILSNKFLQVKIFKNTFLRQTALYIDGTVVTPCSDVRMTFRKALYTLKEKQKIVFIKLKQKGKPFCKIKTGKRFCKTKKYKRKQFLELYKIVGETKNKNGKVFFVKRSLCYKVENDILLRSSYEIEIENLNYEEHFI